VRSFLSAGLDTNISASAWRSTIWRGTRSSGRFSPPIRRWPAPAFERNAAVRFCGAYVFRTTPHETEIAGVRIGKHEKVLLLLASATATRPAGSGPTNSTSRAASRGISVRHRHPRLRRPDGFPVEAEAVLGALATRVASIGIAARPSTGIRAVCAR